MRKIKKSYLVKSSLEIAIEIACRAHVGQKDKAGATYILHPFRVMMAMETDEERIIAVLHDVIEDSTIALEDLMRTAGFSQEIIEAVDLLTHKQGDTYEDYIKKIKKSALARKVKIADLRDNRDIRRLLNPTVKDFARSDKYEKALSVLLTEKDD